MHEIVDFIANFANELGYIGIFIMMAVESSFIPFPSEIAMIPAGYNASLGNMNIVVAFLAGTAGAIIGSSINYFGAKYLGKPTVEVLIHKYGKYFLITPEKYSKSEIYFQNHGAISTFVGRLIPAVRQLISIPAGLFNMPYTKFIFYTTLGAGLWNIVLLAIGFIAGENKQLIEKYSHLALIGVVIFIIVIIILYKYFNKHVKKHNKLNK